MITITPLDQVVGANMGRLHGEHGFRFYAIG